MKAKNSRITIDPNICHGKPTIRGLRYPVETMLELLASGMTIDEILEDYEDLEREDLLAVINYAARLSQIKRVETATEVTLLEKICQCIHVPNKAPLGDFKVNLDGYRFDREDANER